MKCECGAWTQVLDTRTNEPHVRRKRICGNNHTFFTREIREELARTISRKRVADHVRVAAERKARYERDMAIVRDVRSGKTHTEVAATHGLSRTMVGNVMAQWSLNHQEQP
jgi:DNA-binding NarL/FixJ family response regulator